MENMCCPDCKNSNIKILVVEIWQKDRTFVLNENGELLETEKEEVYFKEESYDSRVLQCLDCKKDFPLSQFEELDSLVDDIY